MGRLLRVEVLQSASNNGPEESYVSLKRLAARAQGGGIIVVPEYAMLDPTGLSAKEVYDASMAYYDRVERLYKALAREKGACVVGHLFEPHPSGKVLNKVKLYDEDGEVVGEYSKTHLFDALGYRESDFTIPGERLFKPRKLCGVTVGLGICYEIRFPEIFRIQTLRGAEIIFVPAAWYRGPGKSYMLEVLASARAQENTVYMIIASNAGKRFVGFSRIVDPRGFSRSIAPPREHLLSYEIDLSEIPETRAVLPLLEHRRPELYKV